MSEPAIFSVVQLADYPATRSRGQEGRVRLDDLLVDREGVDLTIDFTGVKVMNISFADEFLGKFLVSHDFAATGTTVKVAGLNADNRYSVVVCVERREARVVVREQDGMLTLVGDKIDKTLSATFEKSIELGTFKANDLAEALSLTAQNANNRLKRLTESGALRRAQITGSTRGGKQFVYQAVSAEIPTMST